MTASGNPITESATTYSDQGDKSFARIKMLLEATGGLSLSQVCAVTGLEGSTIQNWVKRGWVAHPKGKRYEEVHIARILIINALKDCIKLEHIASLMAYVNGRSISGSEEIIKESTLYNYLCEAMKRSGQVDDASKGGVESVVESVIKDYNAPSHEARVRIRKALTLMMFACVCTDVKRRTEAMMGQILKELDGTLTVDRPLKMESRTTAATIPAEVPAPTPVAAPVAPLAASTASTKQAATTPVSKTVAAMPASVKPTTPIRITLDEPEETVEETIATRKTVSQALREWDISSIEKIIIDHDEEARNNVQAEAEEKKPPNRPWYIRKPK